MQTVAPGQGQIFARPDEAETKTASGILLSDKSVEKPRTAKVINVGEGVKWYEANDTIVYKSYAPTELKLNNEDFILIAVEDVLGKVIEVEE